MDQITKPVEEIAVNSISFTTQKERVTQFTETQKIDKVGDQTIDISKPTALDRIKNVSKSLGELEGDGILHIVDSFEAIRYSGNRKDFKLEEDSSLKEKWSPNHQDLAYGSLDSKTFEIDEESEMRDSKICQNPVTIDEVKALQKHVGGELSKQVNFDMLNEVRQSVYNAQLELEKFTGVKDSAIEDLETMLTKTKEVLEAERKEIVLRNLNEIIKSTEISDGEFAELSPDERDGYSSAMYNLNCARLLVTKAGFKSEIGMNEQQVIDHIVVAEKLWPKLKEDARFQVLSSQIFNLS